MWSWEKLFNEINKIKRNSIMRVGWSIFKKDIWSKYTDNNYKEVSVSLVLQKEIIIPRNKE